MPAPSTRWPSRGEFAMKRVWALGLLIAAPVSAQPAGPSSAPAPAAGEICGLSAPTVAGLHAAALADKRFKSSAKDARMEIVSSDELQAILVFVGKGHAAYPAAVCRQVVNRDDTLQMDRQIRCEANAAACARFTAEQDAMDDGSGDGE